MSEQFHIKKGDTSPAIRFQLTLEDGQTLIGATAVFRMQPLNGGALKVDGVAAVDDAENILSYEWVMADTDTAGIYSAEFVVTYADTKIETFPNDGTIKINVGEDVS